MYHSRAEYARRTAFNPPPLVGEGREVHASSSTTINCRSRSWTCSTISAASLRDRRVRNHISAAIDQRSTPRRPVPPHASSTT
jgi:hypothetical protein